MLYPPLKCNYRCKIHFLPDFIIADIVTPSLSHPLLRHLRCVGLNYKTKQYKKSH